MLDKEVDKYETQSGLKRLYYIPEVTQAVTRIKFLQFH